MARHCALCLLAAMLWAQSALAATVVLVQPAHPAPGMTQALVRIHGELMSAGFSLEIVEASAAAGGEGESRGWLEALAAQRGADAVVAMIGDENPDSVEVWVIDKVTGKSVVRRVPYQPASARAPETMAIQAIELLRASFLEVDLAVSARPSEPRPAPEPTVARFIERKPAQEPPARISEPKPAQEPPARISEPKPAPEPPARISEPKPAQEPPVVRLVEPESKRRERLGIALGAATLLSFDGVGPAVLPVLRVEGVLRPWLVGHLTAAGLGYHPSVRTTAGSATVAQAFVALGASYRFRAAARVRPFVALSSGLLHTSVDGRPAASSSCEGLHAKRWSWLLDGGLGVDLGLTRHLHVALAAHLQMAEPYPSIRFVDAVVATAGRPSLLFTLTLEAWP